MPHQAPAKKPGTKPPAPPRRKQPGNRKLEDLHDDVCALCENGTPNPKSTYAAPCATPAASSASSARRLALQPRLSAGWTGQWAGVT